jgi:hypothetical protein
MAFVAVLPTAGTILGGLGAAASAIPIIGPTLGAIGGGLVLQRLLPLIRLKSFLLLVILLQMPLLFSCSFCYMVGGFMYYAPFFHF